MAVADCIEMSEDWSTEKVQQADDWLTAAGVLSLSEVRRRFPAKRAMH